jgi:preprotein translocase subunit YajC
MGNMILAVASKTTSSSGSSSSLLPFLAIVVVVILLYWTMTRRTRQRQAQQMSSSLVPGQPVRTTSGMYGTVASAEGDDIMVEVSPGVQIRMMRRAVVPVPPDGAAANGMGTTTMTDADTGTEPADEASANGSEPESADEDDFDDRKSQDRNF